MKLERVIFQKDLQKHIQENLRENVLPDREKWLSKAGRKNILVIAEDDAFARQLMGQGIAVAVDETAGARSSCPYVVTHPEEMEFSDFERIYRRQKGIPWTILTTERCILREFSMGDLDDLMELYAQPGVTRYTEPLRPYQEEAEYQRDYIRYVYGIFGYGMWLVMDRASGRLIGRAGIETNERCGDGEAELGYVIHPDFWNRGIATEVCGAILRYGREELGLRRFFARTHRENAASRAVLEKLGMRERATEAGETLVYRLDCGL